jgi:Asp-tRNA(Asn)/Glu-tRNA(Gln) amidotransferase A subunit family amidase
MNASDGTIPVLRPYLPATVDFAAGKDSPREFLERCLAALESWEPRIGAFVALNLPEARAAADRATARWHAGAPLSPIDGMPLGIKDIIETADMPTQNGSPLFAGFRSERDAASVAALREAGGVIVGKTVTTEFAATEPRGTRNPWDAARTPGGSSSGSAAAVGAGVIPVALGTQVIGSTLRPASFCGCYGFKPTVGALNRGGSYYGLSQSATGMIAASLPEAWQVAYEIARRAGGDPGCPGLYGPATPPAPARPRQLALLETDGWADATPGRKEGAGRSPGPPDPGRHRHRDALRPRRHRGGGDRHPRRA